MSEHTTESHTDGFSADWLTLRENADHLARSTRLTQQLLSWKQQFPQVNISELGTGIGSNLRYLCPQLGHRQRWTLYDNDMALLHVLPQHLAHWCKMHNASLQTHDNTLHIEADKFSAHVQWQHVDLSSSLDTLPLQEAHLVTGSALLDLTSSAWLEQLASRCIQHHCASLFVLNYNGSIQWQEPLMEDDGIASLLNSHQLKDKGFGAALGPQAHAFFAECLASQQQVDTEPSDWVLGDEQLELQQALIDGWAPAALEQNPLEHRMIDEWQHARSSKVQLKASSVRVGHTDILSLPRV